MIDIVCGSNRPNSKSMEISLILKNIYTSLGVKAEILDLRSIPLSEVDGTHYSENQPKELKDAVDRLTAADGIVVVCPEYNGSMPGALKYFIDHWKYPDTFEYRPVSFIGLGGRFGGLRPIEHLQQVFGYRNAFIFPERIFISNIWSAIEKGQIKDPSIQALVERQCRNFIRFVKALKAASLDANSVIAAQVAATSITE